MSDRTQAMTVKQFKALVAKGQRPENVLLIKTHTPDKLMVDQQKRQAAAIVSTSAVDRDRDVVKAEGWDLDEYKRNPVVLFAHKSEELPIANSIRIGVHGNMLKSVMQFPEPGVHPFADTVYGLVKGDFLRAVSAGFRPIEYQPNTDRDGMDFTKQRLMEYSVVPIPSNPEALIEAKAQGIVVEPMIEWCVRMLDTAGHEPMIALPRSKVEKALAVLDTKRHVFFGIPAAAEPVMQKIAGLLTQEQGEALLESVQQLEEVLAEIGLSSVANADPMARAEGKEKEPPPAKPVQADEQTNDPEADPNAPLPEAEPGPEQQPGEGDVNMPEEDPKKRPPFPPKRAAHAAPVTKNPPWKVQPKGGKFVVVGEEDGKEYGSHATQEEADAQVAALYANAKAAADRVTKGKTLARVRQRAGKYQVLLSNGEVLDEYDVAENAERAVQAINSAASAEPTGQGDDPGKIAPDDVVLKLADGGPVAKAEDIVYHLDDASLKALIEASTKKALDEIKLRVLGQLPD